jgi:hypothetical protein
MLAAPIKVSNRTVRLGLVPVSSQRPVRCRQVLAGIIQDYYREAAQCSFPLVDQFLDTTGIIYREAA